MQRHGHAILRLGLGLIFIWFGAPKLSPGMSPAEDLVAATVPCFDPGWFVPALGLAEILIGVCLCVRRWVRLGLLLMAAHMLGAAAPLITLPEIAWKAFPIATLEGQYILKNIVLVSGAIVVAGATATRTHRLVDGDAQDTGRARPDEPHTRPPFGSDCLPVALPAAADRLGSDVWARRGPCWATLGGEYRGFRGIRGRP